MLSAKYKGMCACVILAKQVKNLEKPKETTRIICGCFNVKAVQGLADGLGRYFAASGCRGGHAPLLHLSVWTIQRVRDWCNGEAQ